MKSYAFITALFYIKTTFAGIEIPRDNCEWLTGISYGVDIKCDGNSNFLYVLNYNTRSKLFGPAPNSFEYFCAWLPKFVKKSPIKFGENFLSKKVHIRAHANKYEIYVKRYLLV